MSPFPKCPICNHPHSKALAHIWDEEKKPDLKNYVSDRVFDGVRPVPPARAEAMREISRGASGREVAVPASDPVKVGKTKREDEVAARQPDEGVLSVQSSQPPQEFTGVSPEYKKTGEGYLVAHSFSFENERRAYQRIYMRHLLKARLENLTVKEWRVKHKIDWRKEL